jgi:MscS family membrane protein
MFTSWFHYLPIGLAGELLSWIIITVSLLIARSIVVALIGKQLAHLHKHFIIMTGMFFNRTVIGYGALSLGIALAHDYNDITNRIIQLRTIFLTSMVVWFLFTLKNNFEKYLLKERAKNSSDRALIGALGKLLTIVLLIFAALSALNVVGFPLQALLTIGGISGLAVSWASKEFIANFFGGLMIFISRPFTIGDRIIVTSKHIEGDVEMIGWYSTIIRNVDKRPLFIPNALLTGAIIENVSRMSHRRFETSLDLDYNDLSKIRTIVDQIEQMLRRHKKIDQNEMIKVHFAEFGDYALKINIRAFTQIVSSIEFAKIEQDILLALGELLEHAGLQMPLPTTSVLLKKSE